jgi:hypothetical protein
MRLFSGKVNPIKTAQALFFLNAAIWLLLGVISLVRMASSGSVQVITALVIAVLMFGNAGAMLVSGIGLSKQQRLVYFFAIAVLVVNIILTITDQFGVVDLITLILDLFLLGLLVATRSQYGSHSLSR